MLLTTFEWPNSLILVILFWKFLLCRLPIFDTVKLGYNDHGYNEFAAIRIRIWKIFGLKWLVYYVEQCFTTGVSVSFFQVCRQIFCSLFFLLFFGKNALFDVFYKTFKYKCATKFSLVFSVPRAEKGWEPLT
jgi:hypothetical protein